MRRATTDSLFFFGRQNNFYPRSPCGERRVTVLGIQHKVGISIHALLAESDVRCFSPAGCWRISIHALLAESDEENLNDIYSNKKFLSTLSLRRATSSSKVNSSFIAYFYPRSPCGERPEMQSMGVILILFLSTLSLRRATAFRQL